MILSDRANIDTLSHSSTHVPLEWEQGFLEALRSRGNILRACEAVGVGRRSAYAYRDRNEEFARLWEEALQDAYDLAEDEAFRRAVEGTEKPVYWQGAVVGTIREYSDTLLQTILKAQRPEKFRERIDSRHSGADGGPIRIAPGYDLSKLSDEDLQQFQRITSQLTADPRALPEGVGEAPESGEPG